MTRYGSSKADVVYRVGPGVRGQSPTDPMIDWQDKMISRVAATVCNVGQNMEEKVQKARINLVRDVVQVQVLTSETTRGNDGKSTASNKITAKIW